MNAERGAMNGEQPARERVSSSFRTHRSALLSAPRWFAIFLIRFYQSYIRPHLFGNCKFTPTCSEYGIGCLEKHGLLRGGWYTTRRVCRCHPFAKGGFDPVP